MRTVCLVAAIASLARPVWAISGACGAADGKAFLATPVAGFCVAGTTSSFHTTAPWTWDCQAIGGGVTAPCQANHQSEPHPRLYLTASKLALLQSRINSHTEPYYTRYSDILYVLNNRFMLETPPAYNVGPYFADPDNSLRGIANRLPFMAMAYKISGDAKYFNAAIAWMDAIITYPHWGSDLDLGAAHLLYNMALTYDWLYSELTPTQRANYEACMSTHLALYANAIEAPSPIWWSTGRENHNFTNAGAMLIAAYAAYENIPNADHYIQLAYDNFTGAIARQRGDGSSEEGARYWGAGMEAILRYFEAEKAAFKVDRMVGVPYFTKGGLFRIYASLPNFMGVIDIGDSTDKMAQVNAPYRANLDWYGVHILDHLASEFRDPYTQWLANTIPLKFPSAGDRIWSPQTDWQSILWYDESNSSTAVAALPRYHLFDDLGLFTSRSAWSDDNATMLVFKAGPPYGHSAGGGSGHVHPDEGQILLYGYGQTLVIDDGYMYRKLTSDHNVATFDADVGQSGEGGTWFGNNGTLTASASIVTSDINEAAGYEYLAADLTNIYRPELQITRYLRHVVFLEKKNVVVIDEIASSIPHTVHWRLHLNADSNIALSGSRAAGTITGTSAGVAVDNISTQSFTASLADESIVSNSDPNANFVAKTYQLSAMGTASRVEVVIRPFSGSAPGAMSVLRRGQYLYVPMSTGQYARIDTGARKVDVVATVASYPSAPIRLRFGP